MATYIGKVQIGNDATNLIALGDTLYGTCNTAAANADKDVTLAAFDRVMDGISIRVKFNNGNEVNTNVTLKVGPTNRYGVEGDCTCSAGDVICFTWEQGESVSYWRVTSSGVSQAIKDYVSAATGDILSSAHGMIFKGTLGTNGTISTLPSTGYFAGWTYKVITAGQYGLGQDCEQGDLIIAISSAGSNQSAFNGTHWTVVQGNLDGTVTGPASAGNNHVAIFDQTTGKIIKDSGFTLGTSVPSDALFTDTNTSYRYTLSNSSVSAYTGNSLSDTEGTVLVTVENGILKLAKGIKFTTSTTTVSLDESSVVGPSLT